MTPQSGQIWEHWSYGYVLLIEYINSICAWKVQELDSGEIMYLNIDNEVDRFVQ